MQRRRTFDFRIGFASQGTLRISAGNDSATRIGMRVFYTRVVLSSMVVCMKLARESGYSDQGMEM